MSEEAVSKPKYKRVLLKLSGESLASLVPPSRTEKKFGINQQMLNKLAADINHVHQQKIQVALLVGGGNFHRGCQNPSGSFLSRSVSDQMGMLATIMNGLALQSTLESYGLNCLLMSALPIPTLCVSYSRKQALDHLEQGGIVIFVAGTGHPYFSTDTAAALRACELDCDLLLKATKVLGVYTEDPMHNSQAIFLSDITYQEVLSQNMKVMDSTALMMALENKIPIAVFSIYENNGFANVLNQQGQFTLIS